MAFARNGLNHRHVIAPRTLFVGGVLAASLFSGLAQAQDNCGEQWLALGSLPGTDGIVAALTMWDPDGSGPKPPQLIIAGEFVRAGDVLASNIVAYDLSSGRFAALGSGVDGPVNALAILPSGELAIGGAFKTAGGVPASLVARWNGSTWAPIGAGIGSTSAATVYALAVLPSGDLVAGGAFGSSTGTPLRNIARWDGSSWDSMNGGLNVGGRVFAMTLASNGDLIVAGYFGTAGGVNANSIARWNGSAWFPIGIGLGPQRPYISAVATLASGDLLASGSFTTINNAAGQNFARWNGSSWSAITPTPNSTAFAFKRLSDGSLLVGGDLTKVGATDVPHIARWDGVNWSPVGALSDIVSALEVLPNGDFVAGGWFTFADNQPASHVARWDGKKWNALGSGVALSSRLLAVLPNDELVANTSRQAGAAASVPSALAERFNGSSWSPFAPELKNIAFVTFLTDGSMVVSGERRTTGERVIVRWTGASWETLGVLDLPATQLIATPGGGLIAAGEFTSVGGVAANRIARWDGAQWSPLGAGLNNTVSTAVRLSNGDIVVAGSFSVAGGSRANRVARWDGAQWSPLGAGLNGLPASLAVLPGGSLVATGNFTASGATPVAYIARWDGVQWSSLGTGLNQSGNALAVLPNGDLVVGGSFTTAGGVPANRLARWNGSSWSAFGSGMNGSVYALALRSTGELVATGNFTIADGKPVAYIARLASTGTPTISVPPAPTITTAGGTLTLSATPTNGYADVSAQWF